VKHTNLLRLLKRGLIVGVVSAALTGVAQAEVVVRIGQQYWPGMSIIAQGDGTLDAAFAELGAKAEYTYTSNGADMNVAMAAGAIDIAMLGTVPAMVAVVNGLPIEIIWLGGIIGSIEALVAREGINSVEELKGKKIAAPFNTTSHFAVIAALEVHGLSVDDVELVDLSPPDTVPAFARGDVDAVFVWDPHKARLIDEFGAKLLYDSVQLDRDTGGKAAIYDLTYAHEDFIREHPELVNAYIRVMDETLIAYRKDPGPGNAQIMPLMGAKSIADVEAAAGGILFTTAQEQVDDGSMDKIAILLSETAKFFLGAGQIERAPSLEEFQYSINRNPLYNYVASQ
jgi:taurine transport system substrate-binding protein